MDQARSRAQKTFGRVPPERLVVACAPSLDVFRAQTGRDWWHYAQTRGDTLNLQNPMLLYTRGLLVAGAQHEYYEWAIGKLTNGRTPRWVIEGMSAYLAREAPVFVDQRREYIDRDMRMKSDDVEKTLAADKDRIPTRIATYNAYLMIEKLVESKGMPAVAAFVLAFGEEASPDAVARRVFSQSYDDVLALASQWKEPAPPVMQQAPATPPDTSHAGHTH
jgi:hypothetical protein